MADVTRHPLLSAEQEIALAQQYERGRAAERQLDETSSLGVSKQRELESVVEEGERARQRLIRCNLRLVVSMAHKYSDLGLPLIDLVQEGNIGLMEAVERYDPDHGVRFSTYAGWWIQQAMRRALTTLQQIADELQVSRERVRQLEKRALRRLRHSKVRHELRKAWIGT